MFAGLFPAAVLVAEPVPVRHAEGVARGFLLVKGLDGAALADGDLIQFSRGDRVTTHVVFHFKDGSLHDETVVFSQRQSFQLISDHLIQKGPSFAHPMETWVEAASGKVSVRYFSPDGKEEFKEEQMQLPADIANGLMFTLLKNIRPGGPATTVSIVAFSASPRRIRLVKLVLSPAGENPFSLGRESHKATHFVAKIDIGGVLGAVAPVIGKKPADTHIWMLEGDAPTFVGAEGPLAFGGPVWRIELACPVLREPASGQPR